MLSSFKRIIKWGFQGFLRNSGASLATTVIMIIVISLITLLWLFQKINDYAIISLENRLALTVYFKENTEEDEILNAKIELERLRAIEKVKYISKEEALEIFTKRHKKNPLIQESLAMIGRNPFLSHLTIKAKTPGHYEELSNFLKEKAFFKDSIDHINYAQISPIIERIEKITKNLANFGIFLSIIFGIIAFLVAFNTIKLSILNIKEEISIMRLVGASDFFIKGPLFVQSILSGFLATVFSLLLFSILLYSFNSKIETFLPGLDLFGYFSKNIGKVILIQFTSAIGLGIISSSFAMKKYLKI
jgi:cell division transport system permease protein